MSSWTARANKSALARRRDLRFQGSCTALMVSEAQCAKSAAWLSRSNAESASQRSASSVGSCFSQRSCRASIALAEALSDKPGAWAPKLVLLTEISRQLADDTP